MNKITRYVVYGNKLFIQELTITGEDNRIFYVGPVNRYPHIESAVKAYEDGERGNGNALTYVFKESLGNMHMLDGESIPGHLNRVPGTDVEMFLEGAEEETRAAAWSMYLRFLEKREAAIIAQFDRWQNQQLNAMDVFSR